MLAGDEAARPPAATERAASVSVREAAGASALLLVLLAIAFGNIVFAGRSLIYTDNRNPLDYRFLPQNNGPDVVPGAVWERKNLLPYANFHDPGATWWQWEPGGEYLRRALLRGEWPWWDPYVGGGTPAMTNLTQAFFFPPYLLMVALGNGALLKNLYFLLLLGAAAFFSYLLLRQHQLSRAASFAGAVAILFCGGLNQNVASFIGQTAACMPVALFFTRHFLERPSWRRCALLAAVYGAIALASFPPLLIAAFAVSALYALVLIADAPERTRLALRYATAAALSLSLVAFYYLPAFTVMPETPQIRTIYDHASAAVLPWVSFTQLLAPTLMDGSKVYANPPMPGITGVTIPYLGVVALVLAGLAGPVRRRDARRLALVLAIAVAFIVLKLAGVQPIQLLTQLPGLRTVHFAQYFGIPLGMLLALGAGLGLDRLLAGEVPQLQAGLIIGAVSATTLAMLAVAWNGQILTHPQARVWLREWFVLAGFLVAAAALVLALAGRRQVSARRRRVVAAAFLALLAAEGARNTIYPRQARWGVWQHPIPYVRELQEHRGAGRIFSAGAFSGNAGSAFELPQLDSLMTFNAPRAFELYRRYAAPKAYLFLREASMLPPEGVLDATNIGLLAIREAYPALIAEALRRGYSEFFDDGYARLFSRPTDPRYYFTSQARRVSRGEALTAIAEPRPRREVLLESDPRVPAVPNDGTEAPVAVESFALDRVVLKVRAPRPGLVYCSEAFFPGWRATVNGSPAEILAANYAFRAVAVPAGDSVVELSYFPPGLRTGALLSLLGVLVAGGLAFIRADSPPLRPMIEPNDRRSDTLPAVVATDQAESRRPQTGAVIATVALVLLLTALEVVRRQVAADGPAAPKAFVAQVQPVSFYRVAWRGLDLPAELIAGREVRARLELRNTGTGTWPDPPMADPAGASGAGAVRVSYRWWSADGAVLLTEYGIRVDLPWPLRAGESLTLPVPIELPATPGKYLLQVDLVQELVQWFERRGADRFVVPVTVGAAR